MADAGARPKADYHLMERPLSPHIQVHKWWWTMIMSIFHRATGLALAAGTLLVAWWLVAAASGDAAYATQQWVMGSIPGRLVLVGYTWALLHHLLGGLRHLVWDTGRGMDKPSADLFAKLNLAGSLGLTALVWAAAALLR